MPKKHLTSRSLRSLLARRRWIASSRLRGRSPTGLEIDPDAEDIQEGLGPDYPFLDLEPEYEGPVDPWGKHRATDEDIYNRQYDRFVNSEGLGAVQRVLGRTIPHNVDKQYEGTELTQPMLKTSDEVPVKASTLADLQSLDIADSSLQRCFSIFKDLQRFEDAEPHADGFAYAYLTEGRSELGERLRRALSPKALQDLFLRSTTDEFWRATDGDDISYFARPEVFRILAESIKRSFPGTLDGDIVQLRPLLSPVIDAYQNVSIELAPELDKAFGVGSPQESRQRASSILRAALGPKSSLECPGKYVLVLTDDGRAFRADLINTLFHSGVREVATSPAQQALVSCSWSEDALPKTTDLLMEFESLVNSEQARENDFQKFFELNPEFLYLLGDYDDVRSQVTVRVEGAITPFVGSTEARPDFFLHSVGTDLWDVLDIKKAHYRTPLLTGSGSSAHNSRSPSYVLGKALGQVRSYRRILDQAPARELLKSKGLNVSFPRCILLMGLEKNFPAVGNFESNAALRSLSAESGVDVVTYDQLFRIAHHKRLRSP